MNAPDFSHAESKIDRAAKHIAEAEAEIRAFLKTDFYSITAKIDQRAGTVKIDFKPLHELGQDFKAIIGDAIGNLRSALDYMLVAINEISVPSKKVEIDEVGFPFANDAPGFSGEVKGPRKAFLPQSIIDILIDQTQAYRGGNGEALWALNKLRNIDKHRFLLATVSISGVKVSFRSGGIVLDDCWFMMPTGQNCTVISAPVHNFQVAKNPIPTCEIRINEVGIVDGVEVIEFLKRASSQAAAVLEAFKKAFGAI